MSGLAGSSYRCAQELFAVLVLSNHNLSTRPEYWLDLSHVMRLAESKKSKKKKKGKADVAEAAPGTEAAPAPADEQLAVTPPETAAVSSAAESKPDSTAPAAEVEEEDGDEAEGEGKVITSSPVSRSTADEPVTNFFQKRHTLAIKTQYRWQVCMLLSDNDLITTKIRVTVLMCRTFCNFFAALRLACV